MIPARRWIHLVRCMVPIEMMCQTTFVESHMVRTTQYRTGVRGYQFALVDAPFTATQVTAPLWLGANYGLPGGVAGVIGNVLLFIAVLPFLWPFGIEFAMMDRLASHRPRTQTPSSEEV